MGVSERRCLCRQSCLNECESVIESRNHLTVVPIEFIYDIWIIKVFRVPIEKATYRWLILAQMRNHGCINERILWS